ncbi:MAG: hypothetical protein ABSG68_24200 [Thermoguttaceae bacterium]
MRCSFAPVLRMCESALVVGLLAGSAAVASQRSVRVLFDFESEDELTAISTDSVNVVFDLSQDTGVTSGKRCCRMTFRKGDEYAEIYFKGDKKEGWQDYDYFAMDVFVPGDERTGLTLEFHDARSKNFATRCSMDVEVVPGQQTVLIPINRPKRNGKGGLSWEELDAQDKIDRSALTRCKLILRTPKDHDLIWRVDNIRLLTEDALGRKISVQLPDGAQAFCFGNASDTPGFAMIRASSKGFSRKGDLIDYGKRWPDPLTGTGVYSPSGKPYTFETRVPDGRYLVWIAAGPIIRDDIKDPRFLLKLGDQTLYDDAPSTADLYGEKYFYRFMNTPYSQREHAIWLDFINRMYPTRVTEVNVAGGKLAVEACNFGLSALIVAPVSQNAAFERMAVAIRAERTRIFEAQQLPFKPKPLAREAGDAAYVCFIPDELRTVSPDTGPNKAERVRKAYDLAAATPQNVIFRLAIASFEDQGPASISMSDLKGPRDIPASSVRWYYQDFRLRGIDVRESALIPTSCALLEKDLTRCFWAWLRLPSDTPPGVYTGGVTVSVAGKRAEVLPVRLKVYPFKLEERLPYAFGMWYGIRQMPDTAEQGRLITEQLTFMREIGFTGVELPGPDANGSADPFLYKIAKAVGMGRHPLQKSHTAALGMGRSIARGRLGFGARVDRNPGCEFENPEFKGLYIESARKFAAFLEKQGLPVVLQTVDEPRDVPNPWNRNLEQTNLYGDYLGEAGITNRYVTPMSDRNSGRDYTSLIDHHDVIATHAGKESEELMRITVEKKKQLWLYNTGMDRLSWGFYNWRVGSTGRYEWHFCWPEEGADNGYPNHEWYNPFTPYGGFTSHAPYRTYNGAMLFSTPFFSCAEGITDTAYLVTLQEKMKAAGSDATKAGTIARAQALLDSIKNEIPFLPQVAGIANEADGALVGQGLKTPVAARCETWRRQIAELIIALD